MIPKYIGFGRRPRSPYGPSSLFCFLNEITELGEKDGTGYLVCEITLRIQDAPDFINRCSIAGFHQLECPLQGGLVGIHGTTTNLIAVRREAWGASGQT